MHRVWSSQHNTLLLLIELHLEALVCCWAKSSPHGGCFFFILNWFVFFRLFFIFLYVFWILLPGSLKQSASCMSAKKHLVPPMLCHGCWKPGNPSCPFAFLPSPALPACLSGKPSVYCRELSSAGKPGPWFYWFRADFRSIAHFLYYVVFMGGPRHLNYED